MNKDIFLFVFLAAIILVLSGSTSYFYLQSKESKVEKSPAETGYTPPVTPVASAPQSAPTPAPTILKSFQGKNSVPKITHTVGKGETLYQIGVKYNLSWETIARVNNLADVNKIVENQVLVISDAEGEKVQISYAPAEKPAKTYASAIEAAKGEIPPVFGLTASDSYTLANPTGDANAPEVLMTIKKIDNKEYEAKLKKSTVWTVSYLKEK